MEGISLEQKNKEENEKAKQDRKLQMEMKQKTAKEKMKRVKRRVLSLSSSESSGELQLESEELYYNNHEHPNPISDPYSLNVGDHIIVSYEEHYFSGVIEEIKKSNAFVSVMEKSLANTWKWPQRQDSLWYYSRILWETLTNLLRPISTRFF